MQLLEPAFWSRALRNPIVLAGLLVDLAPVYAVFAWGWGAAPLVMLYWIENVLIGVMTVPRIVVSGARLGLPGVVGGLFMAAFFVVHYGMFCAVHGAFLLAFLQATHPQPDVRFDPLDVTNTVHIGLGAGEHMVWILSLLVAWQLFLFLYQFMLKGGWKTADPGSEMMSPYGRIIVMHFAIFAGAAALAALGDPMIGVLGLILLRAAFGIHTNMKQRANPVVAPATQPS